jgi:hypothetical protein
MAINELPRVGECITYMLDPDYCTATGTVAVGNNAQSNQIYKGPLTAMVPALATDTTGLYVIWSGGDATTAAKKVTFLERGPITVNSNFLIYPSGATGPQKTAINTYLNTIGIKVK